MHKKTNRNQTLNETAQALWETYRRDRTQEHRNALATHFQPFVEYLAKKTFKGLVDNPEFEASDLAGFGAIALLDLIERFDPGRGVFFTTFAGKRLVGSMIDGIRQMDWVPRLERRRERDGQVQAKRIKSLDCNRNLCCGGVKSKKTDDNSGDYSERLVDVLANESTSESEQALMSQDFWDGMLKGFNEQERSVLTLYYREHLTMREVGSRIGLSESRVSQVHSAIVERLKAKYPKNDGRWN